MSNLAKAGVDLAEHPEARLFQPKRWRNGSKQNHAETSGFSKHNDAERRASCVSPTYATGTNCLAWREA